MIDFGELFAKRGLSLDRLRSFLMIVEAGGIAKAAEGDPTRQSQFSRQVKELEEFFGVALTRRVGKSLEITEEGLRLADISRMQFRELANFHSVHTGGTPALRIGCSASVTQWMLMPRLSALRGVLRGASLDLIQMRSKEVVRAVADGRIDLGVVRRDAVPPHLAEVSIGEIGYSLFGPKRLAPGAEKRDACELLHSLPLVQVLSGGSFEERFADWLEREQIRTNTIARVSSFVAGAEAVLQGIAGAVLPDIAASALQATSLFRMTLPFDYRRELSIVGNLRALDRAGFDSSILQACVTALRTD